MLGLQIFKLYTSDRSLSEMVSKAVSGSISQVDHNFNPFGMLDVSPRGKVLHQKTILGLLSLDVFPKELILLKLRHAPREESMALWSELWRDVRDYDDLPAGCRTLMPSVVRRMQALGLGNGWMRVHGLDLSYLAGLPRFVWTKNSRMLNQTLRIASHVGRLGIEIIAIKGVAAMLSDKETGMMRSTSDLDLLVRPDDFDAFGNAMCELGYKSDREFRREDLDVGEPYVFKSKDGKMPDVDAHLIADTCHPVDRFTEMIWHGKVPSNACPTLFLPSPRETFWMAVIHAYRYHNWFSGTYMKYLDDALSILPEMDRSSIREDFRIGRESVYLQDWQEQILRVGFELGIVDEGLYGMSASSQVLASGGGANRGVNGDYRGAFRLRLSHQGSKRMMMYLHFLRSSQIKGDYLNVLTHLLIKPFDVTFGYINRRVRRSLILRSRVRNHKKGGKTGYILKRDEKKSLTPVSQVSWRMLR